MASVTAFAAPSIEEDEKRKKRLARNRESARECRRRKKAKQISLKQQIAHLEADNLQLRLKLQMESEAVKYEDECSQITSRLKNMINEGASDASIQKELSELQERYSDYGRDRRSAIDFHIAQLRRCLQPTQTTQTIMWLMSNTAHLQESKGNGSSAEKADLWRDLVDTLKPTPDQLGQFISITNAEVVPELKSAVDTADKMLSRLVELVSNKNDSLDQEMAEIQRILSARQIAKFILWIDQNPACMQVTIIKCFYDLPNLNTCSQSPYFCHKL